MLLTVAVLSALALQLPARPAFADMIPSNIASCDGRTPGAACATEGWGRKDGVCVRHTCTRYDMVSRENVEWCCLRCTTDPSSAKPGSACRTTHRELPDDPFIRRLREITKGTEVNDLDVEPESAPATDEDRERSSAVAAQGDGDGGGGDGGVAGGQRAGEAKDGRGGSWLGLWIAAGSVLLGLVLAFAARRRANAWDEEGE